ncbi:hypothetical protein AB0D08_27680 [Kitasatospora sp. NPDC048540]|uniref:hypothetical protein n=1 Tax=Kitasatospora sp. NPDC048540 TaxID=3155634 RepID=UPI0033C50430
MPSLYEVIAKVASDAVVVAVAGRSDSPLDTVRAWDGTQAVWLAYETHPEGRVEAHLTVRPADVKMLGMEESSDEFLLVVGSRAWRGDDHRAFWSSPERYSRVVGRGISTDELSAWVSESLGDALGRASRELRPLRAVGGKTAPTKKTATRKKAAKKTTVAAAKEAAPAKKVAAKKTTVAAAKEAAPAKKVAAKKTTVAAAKEAAPAKKVAAKKTTAAAAKKAAPAKKTTSRRQAVAN